MNPINHSIITISGDPASGKSTVVAGLKDYYSSLGTNVVSLSIGDLFRDLANKEGFSVSDFNKESEKRPEIDRKLDDLLKNIGKRIGQNPKENTVYLIDSRMAWNFIPESFSIRLTVNEQEAGKRVFEDTSRGLEDQYSSLEDATTSTAKRKASEISRYQKLYGVDLSNADNYNLVIDTSRVPVSEVLDTIHRCVSLSAEGKYVCKRWANPGYFIPTQDIRQSENSHFQDIKSSIETDGFQVDNPIDSVLVDDNLWVIDGHNRIGATFDAQKHLVPYKILAQDNNTSNDLAGGLTAKEFVESNAWGRRGLFYAFDYDGWWKFIPNIDEIFLKHRNAQEHEER